MKIKNRSRQKLSGNLRFQALVILDQVLNQQAYSNVVLDRFLSESKLSPLDNQLLVRLVYGVIQRKLSLEYYLSKFTKLDKLEDWVKILLLLSIYQIDYLDRIPDHAVVHEAVKIGKIQGHQGVGNLINGVLRSYLRQSRPDLNEIQDRETYLSIKYSIPADLIQKLSQQLKADEVEPFLASLLETPYLSVRINASLTYRDQVIDLLEKEGFQLEASDLSPFGIRILEGDIFESEAFQAGLITVQDESSMLVGQIGQLEGDEAVLDACAAPGGKTTHIASYLDEGHVLALDISQAKLQKVIDHSQRMKLSDRITCQVMDARKFELSSGRKFDKIFIDAPCSGLGLMRRKPEIKYHDHNDIYQTLSQIQLELLSHLYQFLKPGGILIYSTCTLTLEENEQVLETFLKRYQDMTIDPIAREEVNHPEIITEEGFIRIWPHQTRTDGFFISRLIKENQVSDE